MKKRLLSPSTLCPVLCLLVFCLQIPSFARGHKTGWLVMDEKNSDIKFPGKEKNNSDPVLSADITVKGTVRDTDGAPLAGATIAEKGTNNKVIVGTDGSFSITVKEGATLVVSFVGFDTQEIPALAGQQMNIALSRQDKTYAEVVVTALGIRKERN